MTNILNNRKFRNFTLQFGYVGGIVGLVIICGFVARGNLEAQGITSGFDFLFKSTGWNVGFSLLEYKASDPYWRVLLIGVLNTLFLGVIGLVLATIIGAVVGMARSSEHNLARLTGAIYVETFRNIPLILQVFFWYAIATRFPGPRQSYEWADVVFLSSRGFYFPGLNITGGSAFLGIVAVLSAIGIVVWISSAQRYRRMEVVAKRNIRLAVLATGLVTMLVIFTIGRIPDTPLVSLPALKGLNFKGGIRVTPELSALAFAIAIYGGAYIAEIVRGGFKSVGKGQLEAAYSVGLSPFQTLAHIKFPLALRAMLPILTNQYVWLIKATTMGIAIGFTDFFMIVSISINQSGQTLELIGILMAGFLVINFSLAAVLNRINKAIALKGNQLRT